ncbi:unnamed protein product, partial [Medioppia subpectinata]
MEQKCVIPVMFKEVYSKIRFGNERWNQLNASNDLLYKFDANSTYIKSPPYFDQMTPTLPKIKSIVNARVLLNLGDSVTTDHISPAGSIARNSPAAKYLIEKGIAPSAFNSYGSRSIFDASEVYRREGTPLIILSGKDYGCGSSRDWAAKGPYLLGVRAVIAES